MCRLHTYYAAAGNTPILVHNDTPVPSSGNRCLRSLINALHKGIGNPNQVGDGTVISAANREVLGSDMVEGRNHVTSTTQYKASLVKFLAEEETRLKGGKRVPNVKKRGRHQNCSESHRGDR